MWAVGTGGNYGFFPRQPVYQHIGKTAKYGSKKKDKYGRDPIHL